MNHNNSLHNEANLDRLKQTATAANIMEGYARDAAFATQQRDAQKAVEQRKRMDKAANHLNLASLILFPDDAAKDNFLAQLQNTPDDKIADAWNEMHKTAPKNTEELAENPNVDGRFRTNPEDLTSPLLPGLIDNVRERVAKQLQADVIAARRSPDPTAVAAAFDRVLITAISENVSEPFLLGFKAFFWNDDNDKVVAEGLVG